MDINATLLGHVIWFGVFIWLTMKYIWPPLQKAMNDRQTQISEGLAAAEQGLRELQDAGQASEKVIADARSNATEIIGQAEKRGSEVVEEARLTAQKEADRIVESAKAEIEQEMARAKEELRMQVSMLAIKGAEKILNKEIDRTAHQKMLAELEREFS